MTDVRGARVILATLVVSLASAAGHSAATAPRVAATTNTTRGLLGSLFSTTTTAANQAPRRVLPAPPPPPRPPANPSLAPPAPPPSAPSTTTTTTPTAIPFPADLLAISMSIRRSGPNSTAGLLDALKPLETFGLTPVQAAIVGMGAFPVAGPATYTDDWLMPRPGARPHLHQGNDIFAATGTPVRAPAAGVVGYHNDDPGGYGLYATVTASDGTYFLSGHLDAFANGLASGATVAEGQVIAFVGASGNAIGGTPHDHFEMHPHGGGAVNPKSFLDSALSQALARVPALVKSYQDRTAPAPQAPPEPRAPTPEELRVAAPGPVLEPGAVGRTPSASTPPSPALIISAVSALSLPVSLLPLVLSPLARRQLAGRQLAGRQLPKRQRAKRRRS